MKPATRVSTIFLGLIAVAHLARVALGIPVMIGSADVPTWCSLVAAIVCGGLAYGVWREHRAVVG